MSRQFHAIYEQGLLRPLEPLPLEESQLVTLSLHAVSESGSRAMTDGASAIIDRQHRAWAAFLERMNVMPDGSPPNGFSNRDHDVLIYGE